MPNPKLTVGQKAPSFTANTNGGGRVGLKDLKGERFFLYFYPKDDTPGCTKQACDFRDAWEGLTARGIKVLGVSPDGVASHDAFQAKHDLPFPLLADPDKKIAERYGVYREKKNYGKTYLGIVRSTFLVDAEGKLEKVYDNVRATGHVARLLRELGDA